MVAKRHARPDHEVLDRPRNEYLAWARERRDSRGDVDRDARELPVDQLALARVQPGPDFESERRDRLRNCASTANAHRRSVERREEPIAGGVDLAAAEAFELTPDDGVCAARRGRANVRLRHVQRPAWTR